MKKFFCWFAPILFAFMLATGIVGYTLHKAHADTYLFSGLGDVTAYHVQEIATDARAHCGAHVVTAAHTSWPAFVSQVKTGDKLIGFSMGANAARDLAAAVSPRKVQVMSLDANAQIGPLTKNVTRSDSVYQVNSIFGHGVPRGSQHSERINTDHLGIPHNRKVIARAVNFICGHR
jgi:hypothetical protein